MALESSILPRSSPGDRIRLNEERYRVLATAMAAIIWSRDPEGRMTDPCPSWEDFTRQTFNEYQDMGWLDAVHPEDRERVQQSWREAVRDRQPYSAEYRLRDRDGQWRNMIVRGAVLLDEAGDVREWIGACTDITSLRAAEQAVVESRNHLERLVDERTRELRELNEQLRVSNRELEDFASVASHDLQEPLRKIQAFGDRLEASAGPAMGEQGRDYLGRMRKAAERMQRLISDLLQFSRVTTKAQPFAPVDLNSVLSDVLGDLESRIDQSRGQVQSAQLPTLDADALQVQQLLQNLIANALKFHRPNVPPIVRVYSEVDGENAVRICVEDNGIGFEEKYLDRIFSVFQRLHPRGEYEGTGIGLALCRKIAERHHGSITARSTPGEGSTFIVTLPRTQSTAENVNV